MHNQKGTAIFTALLMVSIVSAIAVTLAMSQRIDIYRSTQLVRSIEAEEYADGAVFWAKSVLFDPNLNPNDENAAWPIILPATLLTQPNVRITGKLEFYNKKFDMNSLKKSEQMAPFLQLVKNTNFAFPEGWASIVANNVQQWISNATIETADEYLLLNPPYRTAHQPMVSVSELRLIDGVNAEYFVALAPYISATNGGECFLLSTTVNIEDVEIDIYTLLQRAVSGGKVAVKLLWQTRGTV